MRRRTIAGLVAAAAAVALVAGVSVVWPGLDAQKTDKTSTRRCGPCRPPTGAGTPA